MTPAPDPPPPSDTAASGTIRRPPPTLPQSDPGLVTQEIRAWQNGEPQGFEALVERVYSQLRRLAHHHLANERPDHTLQATALVHEVYLRLMGSDIEWEGRAHFLAVAASAMRRILVDYARGRSRIKRGRGWEAISLDTSAVVAPEPTADLAALDDALVALAVRDARKARIVELHYFGGLTYDETASALGVSPATVDRDLRFAKAWIYEYLET